jgi:hypothetical protein
MHLHFRLLEAGAHARLDQHRGQQIRLVHEDFVGRRHGSPPATETGRTHALARAERPHRLGLWVEATQQVTPPRHTQMPPPCTHVPALRHVVAMGGFWAVEQRWGRTSQAYRLPSAEQYTHLNARQTAQTTDVASPTPAGKAFFCQASTEDEEILCIHNTNISFFIWPQCVHESCQIVHVR